MEIKPSKRGPLTQTSYKTRYSSVKSGAAKRGIDFELTKAEYKELTDDAACYYCGEELPHWGHGVDRVNNNLGYTADNVVACCAACNAEKRTLTAAEWFAVIRHRVDVNPGYYDH